MTFQPGVSGNPAGKPKGAGARPYFRSFVSKEDIEDFMQWVKATYKHDPMIGKWYGDQIFGKALQSIGGPDGEPLLADEETRKKIKNARDTLLGSEGLDQPAA